MGSPPHNTPAIAVRNLVKRYPKATTSAVDNISFSVQRGEIFGLLGPNGAGKTTTMGILTTGVVPTSGTAHIMNIDVARDPIRVKQRISVVPQRCNLDQSLTVREILTFHASYHGVPRAERNTRADTLLAQLGLAERGNDKVQSYSGGMAQRVMLARALMHTPDVLFLDEPTNNLDPQARLFLWEQLRALHAQGVSILLTTHDMEEANQLCERIAIMDHGQILVCDTPAALETFIPAGMTLDVSVYLPTRVPAGSTQHDATSDPSATSELRYAFSSLPGVTNVEEMLSSKTESQTDVTVFRLYAADAQSLTTGVIQMITDAHAKLRDLRIARPTLEDVFIYLTGRNLRP